MEHPGFFERAGPFSLRAVAEATGAQVPEGADAIEIRDVRPLDAATTADARFSSPGPHNTTERRPWRS